MITVNNVTKVYETFDKKGWFKKQKREVLAVNDLSLQLHPGEIIGLLGLNGAGKTTTIKMISTLLEPTSGSITIDGLDIVKDRKKIQEKINMIAGGERMIYWRLTGRENMTYFGRLYGLSEDEIAQRTAFLLKEVGLEEAADIPVEQYSKGMKQRLQIARGLINDPDYLLLDEPTLGLDAPIARQLRIMIKQLAKEKGKGILLTSHYLQEVEELCDRVYVINRGELVLCDTPKSIVNQTAGLQTLSLELQGWQQEKLNPLCARFSMNPELVAVQAKEGTQHVLLTVKTESADALVPKVISWLVSQDILVHQIETQKPTLEDAIIHLSEGGKHNAHVLASVSG